jgi:hypothetical protein
MSASDTYLLKVTPGALPAGATLSALAASAPTLGLPPRRSYGREPLDTWQREHCLRGFVFRRLSPDHLAIHAQVTDDGRKFIPTSIDRAADIASTRVVCPGVLIARLDRALRAS